MGDQWNRMRNNGDNQFDKMRARATSEDQLRRINNAQNLFNRRVEGAQNGFNAFGDAIGGIFDSSPAPKTKSSSGSGGLGLLVAGAAIAGGAYLFKKFFGSNDKDKNKTQQQTLAQK